MNVLHLAGIDCQPLSEFGQHFDIKVGDCLKSVWIGHKNAVKRVDVQQGGLSCLVNWSGQIPVLNDTYRRFNSAEIANAVVSVFKRKKIVDYIFEESFLLMKWDNGSFEEVVNSDLNNTLLRVLNSSKRKRQTTSEADSLRKKICIGHLKTSLQLDNRIPRWPRRSKTVTVRRKKLMNCPVETISLDTFLYNCKQHRKYSISANFLHYVANVPLSLTLKIVLEEFLEREKSFSKNNGYYRMFQKNIRLSGGDDQLKPVLKQHVISFACDILRGLLPFTFFGNSNRIRKRFYSVIAQFIKSAKHQAFSVSWFIECFQRQPQWINEIQLQTAVSVVKFLVADFMGNILKTFFYITECGSSGYELFFYRKSDIESLKARKINQFITSGVLKRVDEDDHLERRWLENRLAPEMGAPATAEMDNLLPDAMEYQPPAAKVRFLLKSHDSRECRMITIAKKPPAADQKWKIFMKRQLRRIEVMGMVKRFLDYLIDTVGTGIRPLYTSPQLKNAWEKIKEMKVNGRKLYFVKTDITDAFGSVNHARLFKLLERWCSSIKSCKELMFWEWVVCRGKLRKVSRRSFSRKLFPNRVLHSVKFTQEERISPKFLIDVVKQVVSLQSLRIGKFLYRVQVGLCQGGAGGLSPRLCDLYYSGLDGGLRLFSSHAQSLLLRGMDDYLYVTADKSIALDFHNLVTQGIPLYHARFNEKKLLTNLFEDVSLFPYLGLNFDIDLLTVEPNFSRYFATSVINFMKLSCAGKDPRFFKEQFLIDRCSNLNTLKLVPIIYQNQESDSLFLRKVFIFSCSVQVQRMLALALYLQSSTDSLKHVFSKISRKLARVVNNLTLKVSASFIFYTFYQILFNYFHKFDSRFSNVTKTIQIKLVHFYQQLDESHDEVEVLLKEASVKLWKPWKKPVN